ncbi:thermonuclease family protein [Lysinibacillus sp. NPDC093712]|uniref:thermonuclease family protein n=1 Tax=Lysinibacillus sp. NPDC093712 TaxID=3390579 RepID=UPI003D01ADC0
MLKTSIRLLVIVLALLMLSGCLESGENLTDKAAAEAEEHEQSSITKQLTDTALQFIGNKELPEMNLQDASNLITISSAFTHLSVDDLKVLTNLFETSASNNIAAGEVLYKATYQDNYDGDTISFRIDAAYQMKKTNEDLNNNSNNSSLKEINMSQTALSGKEHIKVRSLLIDAPEIVNKKTGQVDEYAVESREFIKHVLENSNTIWLKHDIGAKQDKYGRELMYIWADQHLLNVLLLEEGLAKTAYINEPNTTLLEEYKQAEKQAKENKKGIWSKK